jgi:hypothetical protein
LKVPQRLSTHTRTQHELLTRIHVLACSSSGCVRHRFRARETDRPGVVLDRNTRFTRKNEVRPRCRWRALECRRYGRSLRANNYRGHKSKNSRRNTTVIRVRKRFANGKKFADRAIRQTPLFFLRTLPFVLLLLLHVHAKHTYEGQRIWILIVMFLPSSPWAACTRAYKCVAGRSGFRRLLPGRIARHANCCSISSRYTATAAHRFRPVAMTVGQPNRTGTTTTSTRAIRANDREPRLHENNPSDALETRHGHPRSTANARERGYSNRSTASAITIRDTGIPRTSSQVHHGMRDRTAT